MSISPSKPTKLILVAVLVLVMWCLGFFVGFVAGYEAYDVEHSAPQGQKK